jgi:hypothetical protein
MQYVSDSGLLRDLLTIVAATDHISAGGPWLKYRGHLENISRNYTRFEVEVQC